MARNVKTIPEKKIDVEKIVNTILKASKLRIEEFLFNTDISLDAYRKMVGRGKFSKGSVENILATFDVNEGFLKGEEDLISSGKLTGVQDKPETPQKGESWEAATFRKIMEGDAEYVLVHKTAFQNHRFTSVEQIEANVKELAEARAEVQRLVDKFLAYVDKTHGLGSLPQLPKVEEAKKDAAV